jgi:hypothetical protein
MRKEWLAGATVFLFVAGSAANAQTDYSMNYSFNTSTAASFNINFTTSGGTNSSLGVYAAPFTASWNGAAPGNYGSPSSFSVYCVDLDHYDTTPSTVLVEPFSTATPGDAKHSAAYWQHLSEAAWLYSSYNPFVATAASVAAHTGNADDINLYRVDAGALQAAIWNVIDGDTDFSVTGGSFNIGYLAGYGTDATTFGLLQGQANTWLTALKNAAPDNTAPGTLFLVDRNVGTGNGQDMLGPAPSITPEGSSFWLLAAGGLPITLIARRRRRARH